MILHLVVGLPGAGKTTLARELELTHDALRLTPDDWHQAVFHDDDPTRWRTDERVDQRDRIEGLLVGLGVRALRLGVDVVLDFGLWGRDERSALRWIAQDSGAEAMVHYLPVGPDEQQRRTTARARTGGFAFTDSDLAQWRRQFEPPDPDELAGGPIPIVPEGHASWWEWAHRRWPSLPAL